MDRFRMSETSIAAYVCNANKASTQDTEKITYPYWPRSTAPETLYAWTSQSVSDLMFETPRTKSVSSRSVKTNILLVPSLRSILVA
jgi:hypothetical protein